MRNVVLSIGSQFPDFKKKAVVSIEKGKDFYFTFLCPTEIAEFNKHYQDFGDRDTVLIGASTDSEFVHVAWRKDHEDLRNFRFPMLADTSKTLAEELGVLETNEKVAYRATFIVDQEGVIRWASLYDLNVGRNVKEVLRVLDALQTDELCPCNWQKGEATLVA